MSRVVVLLAVLVWLAVGLVGVVQLWQQPPATRAVMLDEDLTNGTLRHGQLSGEWAPSIDGLVLGPGHSGVLTVDVPVSTAETPSMRLWVHGRDDLPVRISCNSPDGWPLVLATVDVPMSQGTVDLAGCRIVPPSIPVTFSAESAASESQRVLDKVKVVRDVEATFGVTARTWILTLCLALATGRRVVRGQPPCEPGRRRDARAGGRGAAPPGGTGSVGPMIAVAWPDVTAFALVVVITPTIRALAARVGAVAVPKADCWHRTAIPLFVASGSSCQSRWPSWRFGRQRGPRGQYWQGESPSPWSGWSMMPDH